MAMNLGYIEGTCADSDVVVRIYYDKTWLEVDPNRDPNLAPLVNGPRGWCLDMKNTSGRLATITMTNGSTTLTTKVQQGDPVITGPQSGRSKTAAQMASAGFTNRGSVGNFQLDC